MAEVLIGDHAILRYLERVQGYDLDPIRKEILAICFDGVRMGARTVRWQNWLFQIRDGCVVTVVPRDRSNGSRIRQSERHARGER